MDDNQESHGTAARQAALRALHEEILACRRCALAGYRVEGQPVLGGGPAIAARPRRVMLVGQAPGRTEAGNGIPFSGPAGRRLFQWLGRAGIAEEGFRSQVYLAAMTRCYPGPSPTGRGDRRPSREELALCRAFLDRQLALVQPELVILVGSMAIEALLGTLRLEDAVGRLHQRDGVTYLPLPHPSGASTWANDPAHRALLDRALGFLAGSGLLTIGGATPQASASPPLANPRSHAGGGRGGHGRPPAAGARRRSRR